MSSKPTAPFLLTDEGLDDVLADCGLCCPDDPLDDVMGCYLPVLDDGFMAALGMGGPPCPGADRRRDELKKDAPPELAAPADGFLDLSSCGGGGVTEVADFDVDMFFADGAPDDGSGAPPNYAPYHAAVPLVAHVAPAGVAPVPAPPLPAHDVPDGAVASYRGSPPLGHDVFDGVPPVFPLPLSPARVPALHGAIVPYSAPPPLPWRDVFDAAAPVSATPPLAAASHDALYGAVVPYRAPPLPAHDDAAPAVPPATTTSSTSSGCCASSMTTWWERDSPPRVSSSPLFPACSWAVPRKKRTRPITRRNHFWLPKARLHPAAPPPPRATTPPTTGVKPSHSKRSTVARQRNRQRQRACSHCSNTETPQWRAGPRGPGTLCNACGIRYKQNGKLFEEYRPSTSPSFESDKHSNRHRKVVKLMERKQALMKLMAGGDTAPSPAPPTGGSGGGGGEFMDVCTYISTG